jgi:hypothetical protein
MIEHDHVDLELLLGKQGHNVHLEKTSREWNRQSLLIHDCRIQLSVSLSVVSDSRSLATSRYLGVGYRLHRNQRSVLCVFVVATTTALHVLKFKMHPLNSMPGEHY